MIRPENVKKLIIAIARRIAKKHREKKEAEDLSARVHGLDMVIGEEVEIPENPLDRTFYAMNNGADWCSTDRLQKEWSRWRLK